MSTSRISPSSSKTNPHTPKFSPSDYYTPDGNDETILVKDENGSEVGNTETKGKRPLQEDANTFATGETPNQFAQKPNDEQDMTMIGTFLDLQQEQGEKHGQRQGTCACVSTGYIDQKTNKVNIHTSYVGDSVTFLIGVAEGKDPICLACNPNLHDNDSGIELGKVSKRGGAVVYGRLYGLAVFRAIGDNNNPAVSHLPDIARASETLEEGYTYYMVTTCDGAMEHLKNDKQQKCQNFANQLGKIFNDAKGATPDRLSELIAENAFKEKTTDNVSVSVARLTTNAVTIATFDGHAGSAVSNACADNFNAYFKKNVMSPKPVLEEKTKAVRDQVEIFEVKLKAAAAPLAAAPLAAAPSSASTSAYIGSNVSSDFGTGPASTATTSSSPGPTSTTSTSAYIGSNTGIGPASTASTSSSPGPTSTASTSSSPAPTSTTSTSGYIGSTTFTPSQTSTASISSLLSSTASTPSSSAMPSARAIDFLSKEHVRNSSAEAREELEKNDNQKVIFSPYEGGESYITATVKFEDNSIVDISFEADKGEFVYRNPQDELDGSRISKNDLYNWCMENFAGVSQTLEQTPTLTHPDTTTSASPYARSDAPSTNPYALSSTSSFTSANATPTVSTSGFGQFSHKSEESEKDKRATPEGPKPSDTQDDQRPKKG